MRVTADFIDGSTASGLMVTIVSENDRVQHRFITREGNENDVNNDLSGMDSGQYTVSVFVVDKDGVPLQRAATKPRHVSVEYGLSSLTRIFLCITF